jgi:hypothetical protein
VDNLDSDTSATGTSNEIGYTLTTITPYFIPFSNTVGSQLYNDLPSRYDDLHLGNGFTINFNQAIDFLLIALANDNDTGDGPNFGLIPSDSKDVAINGTQISITDIGGALLLYEFTSPVTSITHTNNSLADGFDVSFFAGTNTAVPIPSAVWLFGSGLIGFLGMRKKKDSNAL